MKTNLITAHEEQYSDGTRTLGVLLNQEIVEWNGCGIPFKESFIYIYNNEKKSYIFFNTIVDLIDYLMYGEGKMLRAYITETDFDKIYDQEFIVGNFNELLIWTK